MALQNLVGTRENGFLVAAVSLEGSKLVVYDPANRCNQFGHDYRDTNAIQLISVQNAQMQVGNVFRAARMVAQVNGLVVKKCIKCGRVHDSYNSVLKNTVKAMMNYSGIAASDDTIHNSLQLALSDSMESVEAIQKRYNLTF